MPDEPKTRAQELTSQVPGAVAVLEAVDEDDVYLPASTITAVELRRRVLEFLNTGREEHLPGGAGKLRHEGQSFRTETLVLVKQSSGPPRAVGREELRANFRQDLLAILKGELSREAAVRLQKVARFTTVKKFEIKAGRGRPLELKPIERLFVTDIVPVLAYALLEIHIDDRLREDVRQCALPGCEIFFCRSDRVDNPAARGRRRDTYCSPEHRDAGVTPAAKRMEAYRARKKGGPQSASKHK